MITKVLGAIRTAIAGHIYPLDQCAQVIEQHGLHFYNRKALAQSKETKVRRSVLHMWIPAVITLIFGLRALAFILFAQWFDTPSKRLAIFSEMLPQNGRRSFEITIMIWSFLHVFYVIYVIRGSLPTFAVLAIFKMNPSSSIKPEHLNLSEKEYQLFARFCQKTRNVCDCICMGYPFVSTTLLAVQGILIGSVMQHSIFLTIFWLVYVYFWLFYACSAVYGLPIFISVVSHYIQVKQTSALEGMTRLCSKLSKYRIKTRKIDHLQLKHFRSIWHRVMRLQRRYGSIQCELRHYTELVSRCLNIIFAVYITIICYITYILFFTKTTFQFKFLYSQIYAINILLLTLLIMRCSAFTRHDPRMRILMIQFYIQYAKSGHFSVRDLLQVDQISQNLRRKNGFTLVNGFRIDTNAYFGVKEWESNKNINSFTKILTQQLTKPLCNTL